MNAPNFTALAADLRRQDEHREYLRKRKAAWLARPLNERESVIRDNLMYALRGIDSEFTDETVVAAVHDHWADADGQRDLLELLRAVADEDSGRAWDALVKSFGPVAKVFHENEV